MPYLVAEYVGEAAVREAQERPPFGPGFPAEDAERATRLVHTGSSFSDPGPNWNRYELFEGEALIGARRIEGP